MNPEMSLKIFDAAQRIGNFKTKNIFDFIKSTYKDVYLMKTE